MVTIELLGPLGNHKIHSNAKNLYELREELQENAEISKWLEDCAIALNDEIITSIDTPLKEGDKITLLPPVCGG